MNHMTFEIFAILLLALAIVTSLITEAVKMFLDSLKIKYACNIVVLIISVLVGGIGTYLIYIYNNIPMSSINVMNIIIMIIANWVTSMLGYDKVIQTLKQIKR